MSFSPPTKVDNRQIIRLIRSEKLSAEDYQTVFEEVALLIFLLYGGGPIITLYNIYEMQEETKKMNARLDPAASNSLNNSEH